MPLQTDGSPWEAPLRRSMQHRTRGLFAGVSNHNAVLALDTLLAAQPQPHRLPTGYQHSQEEAAKPQTQEFTANLLHPPAHVSSHFCSVLRKMKSNSFSRIRQGLCLP